MRFSPKKLGLGTAIVAVVLGGIVVSSLLVHLTWWRTARAVSYDLVDTLSTSITKDVRAAWWQRVVGVQALTRTTGDLLNEAREMIDTETIILAASRYTEALGWMILVRPDDTVIAVEREDADIARLMRARPDGAASVVRAVNRAGDVLGPGELPGEGRLAISGQSWLKAARALDSPRWLDVETTPEGAERGIAYAMPTQRGVLASILGYDRFAQLLGSIPVAETGRSYVLGPDGRIVIKSIRDGSQPMADLDIVARAAGERVTARPENALNIEEKVRLRVDGERYAVGLTPLWFKGWQLAIIIPEAEFLAGIDRTIRWVVLGLAFFLVMAGILVAVFARRFIADPVGRIADDLRLVERFELEDIPHRPSTFIEIDRLSAAIRGMAVGLADFGKFIPLELVRSLVTGGKRAEPGGESRELTIMFADLAGFTSLSERLGDGVVPIVSSYLELASSAIEAEGGTVDKFIGDAVMAFWGAPSRFDDHALRACRAALAIEAGMAEAAARGEPLGELRVRIGLHTGRAIVGNVGSARRLNYTALGDAVNLASRLESVNKIYGTTVLASTATFEQVESAIQAREIDAVTVYGRQNPVQLYELTGLHGDEMPAHHSRYAAALTLYRQCRFAEARDLIRVNADKDGPSRWLAARCEALDQETIGSDWQPITRLDSK
ncbi:MAG: adenylate/guanylate cyclase domain-containing protein [Pseudomonadota bacterium]